MTIDAYLALLERFLPRSARLRALAEVREHLRDAAARQRLDGVAPAEAELAATAAFGPAEVVAARLGRELAIRELRLAALIALGAVVGFVLPLYVVPESTLPSGLVSEPDDILLWQRVAFGCWLAAGALASAAAVLAWRRPRLASGALLGTAAAIASATAAHLVVAGVWLAVTPATPNLALAAPFAVVCLALCAATAWWSRASRHRLAAAD